MFRRATGTKEKGKTKRKFKKLDVFSVFMLMQDLAMNPLWKESNPFFEQVASHIVDTPSTAKSGKATSGRAILTYYQEWREKLPEKLGFHLDSRRLFDEPQKQQIHKRDGGKCRLCDIDIPYGEGEYDHFPTPHYLGGATSIENGRLVCLKCHPRGRPISESGSL